MVNRAKPKDVWEYLEELEKIKTRKDKIAYLKEKAEKVIALRDVIQGAYDDRVAWLLPKGPVPYTPAREESHPSTLLKKNRDFAYFVKTPASDKMPQYKREGFFIGMLEAIHPKDAEIVVKMINKEQLAKGLTKKLVQEALPELGIK